MLFNKYGIQLGLQFTFIHFWSSKIVGNSLNNNAALINKASVQQNTNMSSHQIESVSSQQNDASSQQPENLQENLIDFDIETILKMSSQGKAIIEIYKKNGNFNDGTRIVIVELLINYMIQNNMQMSSNTAKRLAENVVKLFPTELMVCIFVLMAAIKTQFLKVTSSQIRSFISEFLLFQREWKKAARKNLRQILQFEKTFASQWYFDETSVHSSSNSFQEYGFESW